jgi:cytoskeletal protein CcmA (bactofilin family)
MFSKPIKPNPPGALQRSESPSVLPALSNASEASRKPRVASLISGDITIEGNVSGDGELQIDGVVRGDVRVGKLTIGDTGHVEGSVTAEAIEVRGRVIGSLTSKQVRLYGTAYVDGDITHEQLAMETGAFFQGRSLKFQRAAAPVAPVTAPAPAATKVEAEDLSLKSAD